VLSIKTNGMLTISSSTIARHELYINEIEFTHKDEVSLFGFLHDCGKFFETQYIISRKDLQILLSQNKAGIEILWQIENLFAGPHAAPASLNLIDLFGTTQVFDTCEIKLDVPHYQDELGNLKPSPGKELFFIEEVIPLNLAGEAKALRRPSKPASF
jgi:hypothetical protein